MEYIDSKDKNVCSQGEKQHPMLGLPVEILCRIFIACLPPRVCTPDPSEAPIILCHICSHWRNVALDLPHLWNTLDLMLGLQSEVQSELFVTNANVWFSRSGTLPLIFTAFIDCSESLASQYVSANSLGELVVKYQSRFQILSLKIINHFTVPPSLGTLSNLHELERLEVKGFSRLTITSAPKLRRLRLDVMPKGLSNIPWPQLTHVDLSWSSLLSPDFPNMLLLMPNLVDGAFFVRGPSISQLHLKSPVILSSLNRLHFIGEDTCTLLSTFSSPALERLDLIPLEKIDYQQFPFANFSNIKILSLSLWAWDWMPDIGFFLGLPYLVSLTLESAGRDTKCNSFLDALQVVDTNPPILPRLEQLHLHLIPLGGFTLDVYCNAIVARCRHTENRTPLLRASLLYRDNGDHDDYYVDLYRLLKSCIDDGLDFSIQVI